MAKNTIAYYTKSGKISTAAAGVGGLRNTLFTAGPEGSKILAISVINFTLSLGGTLTIYVNDGISDNAIVTLTSAELISSGDIFTYLPLPKTGAGSKYININAGCLISAAVTGSPASALIFVYGEDY
jgi:hypothetical protein